MTWLNDPHGLETPIIVQRRAKRLADSYRHGQTATGDSVSADLIGDFRLGAEDRRH